MSPTHEPAVTTGAAAAAGPGADRERIELIKKTVAQGATDAELELFLYQAKRLGLDPLLGQIKFVKRRRRNHETGEWEEVGTIMLGIDGLRALAERTGKYGGQDEPEWEERGGPYPHACTVRVYRKDFPKPIAAKVFWAEYAPLDRNGQPMALWATKPRFMLAKVCEALALRKAFPADLSGIYTEEEFDQDRGETPRRPPQRPPRAPHRLPPAPSADVNPETGELLAPPEPDDARETDPAAPSAGQPTANAAPLPPEKTHALQLLVAQAARAEGFAGRTPGQDWLERHYGTRSLRALADRLDDVRARALAVLQARATAPAEPAAHGAPAGAARMPIAEFRALVHKAAVLQGTKGPTPGKAWLRERYGTDDPARLTDAQYADAISHARATVDAATRRDGLASPRSIALLEAAFDRLQYDAQGRAGLIRASTNDRTDRPEEMTEVEIQALIDELGGPAPGAPAGTSATLPLAVP